MGYSFAIVCATGLQPARNPSQFTARGIVPQKGQPYQRQYSAFFVGAGTACRRRRLLSWNRTTG